MQKHVSYVFSSILNNNRFQFTARSKGFNPQRHSGWYRQSGYVSATLKRIPPNIYVSWKRNRLQSRTSLKRLISYFLYPISEFDRA